jgi:hypothetical protein
LWKWTVRVDDLLSKGQATTKAEAVTDAERAINRALAPKNLSLCGPIESDEK